MGASVCCVECPNEVDVVIVEESGHERKYTFDRAYWSHDESSSHFATQETLMQELGLMLQSNTLAGYNSCLFAYGQTGAGKTHSVLGLIDPPEMRGLLPRIVEHLFEVIEEDQRSTNPSVFEVTVSYLEIYNEVINDLLVPPSDRSAKLEIHQHPKLGVHIPGLTMTLVSKYEDVQRLIDFGAKTRTVAATCMNPTSSRSHCVFSVELQKKSVIDGVESFIMARLNLVDLAGSERQKKTEASGSRLKEGSMINQSLTNLAIVISKLADAATKRRKKNDFIPFRNSKLTYILQDSLSGNSKTVMMAAISPALDNAEETTTTLRFAESVKKIKTSASKNEESKESLVDQLKQEIENMKKMLESGGPGNTSVTLSDIESLKARQTAYGTDLHQQLEDKKAADARREEALADMGLTNTELASNLGMTESTPQLININEDPSLSGCLIYFILKDETILVGKDDKCKIKLSGLGIQPVIASLFNYDDIKVTLSVEAGRVLVNGKVPKENIVLHHQSRLIFGHAYCFRVSIPNDLEGQKMAKANQFLLTEALAEIVPSEAEDYKQCLSYVNQLQARVGSHKAKAFMIEFGHVVSMVDEANMIAAILRPREHLQFCAEVMTDIYTYETDEPECMVRLTVHDTPLMRLKKAIKRRFMVRDTFSKMASTVNSSIFGDSTSATLAVWDLHQFKLRLKHMRDLYQLFAYDPEHPDLSCPLKNPFVQFTSLDVATFVRTADKTHEKLHALELEKQFLKEAHANKLEATRTAIAKFEAEAKERENRLNTLESANARLRELMGLNSDSSGEERSKTQLQALADETARAQKLTQDLFAHFQKTKTHMLKKTIADTMCMVT